MSDLEHLTEEQKKSVLEIYPKDLKDLESSDEGVIQDAKAVTKPEDDRTNEQKEDWKKGYTDYEVKKKDSDKIQFQDDEIEIIEEDM